MTLGTQGWAGVACVSVLVTTGCAATGGGEDPGISPLGAPTTRGTHLDLVPPPALPSLTPCPGGWLATPDRDHPEVVTCDPWGGQGRERCEGASAHLPGEEGCVPIGGECPADGSWPEDLPDDGVVYVRPGAPGGGIGSRERPAATIARALALAGEGEVIALAPGVYDAPIALYEESVTIRGACAARTILTAPPSDATAAVVWIESSSDVELRDLTIRAERIGVYAIANVDVRLEGVFVDHPKGYGMFVAETSLSARDVVVRDVALGGPDGGGRGVEIVDGSEVTFDRISIERPATLGIGVAFEGTRAMFRDSVVYGYGPRRSDGRATGIEVFEGGEAELERVVIDGLGGAGVNVATASRLEATDLVVTDTDTCADGQWGNAVTAFGEGTHVELARTWIARAHETAITASRGAEVFASDVVVADTLPPSASDSGALLGYGAESFGATLELERAAVLRSHGPGLGVGPHPHSLLPTRMSLTDVSVLGEGRGYGLQADGGHTEVALRRVRFAGSRETTMFALRGAVLDGGDVIVEDLVPGRGIYPWARALEAIAGASATLEGLDVRRATGIALYVNGGDLALSSTIVDATARDVCPADDTDCDRSRGGLGLAVTGGGVADLRSFRITGSELAGVAFDDGEVDLHDGAVVDNLIGAHIVAASEGDEAFLARVARLQDDVLWDNRERNFSALALPIPGPSVPMPSTD